MDFPQIRISQTYAKIGLQMTPPVQEIEQPSADLTIKQIPAEMTIEREPSKLTIDQEEARNQLNVKKISVLSEDLAEYAKQEGLKAIAEIAEEGDRMANIKSKENAIVSIAKEKAAPPPADFNIAFIPSFGSVHIQYTPAEVHIDWKLGGAEVESKINLPIHHYTPGKTEVYMRQMQQIQIDFIGGKINQPS